MRLIIDRFKTGKSTLGADEITARLHTPLTITHDIVDQMDQERQNSQNNQPLHIIVL